MTVWATPWAFLALIPLMAIGVWIWWARKRRTATVQFSHLSGFLIVHRGYRAYMHWLPIAVKIVALVLAVVALARPQRRELRLGALTLFLIARAAAEHLLVVVVDGVGPGAHGP